MMFRIVETKKGWKVEIKQKKFFGLITKWKPYVKTSGMDSAWYHSTFEYALMNLTSQVEKETIIESRKYLIL